MELKQKMKRYRKWQLFHRQRRRRRLQQQAVFITIIGLFITFIVGIYFLTETSNSNNVQTLYITHNLSSPAQCHCSKSSLILFNRGECFFNQLVCYPGFTGDRCEIELTNEVASQL